MNKRSQCPNCNKALKACICAQIKTIDSEIELIILQHPNEAKNPIGTARILDLSLPNCQIIIGEDFTHNETLNEILSSETRDCYLLYPSEESTIVTALCDDRDEAAIRTKRITCILLDSTWRKAYRMYQVSSNLHRLPALRLEAEVPSQYKIRQSSKAGGLSTVEAGYLLLSALDKQPDKYQSLLSAFNYMIDYQIAQMGEDVYRRNYLNKSQ